MSSKSEACIFKVHILNGALSATGGDVSLKSANGTFADTTITFSGPTVYGDQSHRNISTTLTKGGVRKV